METTGGEGGRERGWRWFPCQAYSASPPTIGFLPGAVVYNAQENRAETPRLQGGQKLSQTLPPHPVQVLLGACAAGKAPKVVLIMLFASSCLWLQGAWHGEAVYTCPVELKNSRCFY